MHTYSIQYRNGINECTARRINADSIEEAWSIARKMLRGTGFYLVNVQQRRTFN